jgi:bifunctional ADP-heptose synthase (sugar kinase/adenylyltransferase)
MNTRSKILPLGELLERVPESRAAGRRVVLAACRFDLISLETVEALQSARKSGALVIAAIAPDSAGSGLLAAEARARLVAALASVDFVTIATAKGIGSALRPDEILDLSSDLAPRLIERFRCEHRE